jgi:hypothetical protein
VDSESLQNAIKRLRKRQGVTPERIESETPELLELWGVSEGTEALEKLTEAVEAGNTIDREILKVSLGLANTAGDSLVTRREKYLRRNRKYATSESDFFRKETAATLALVERIRDSSGIEPDLDEVIIAMKKTAKYRSSDVDEQELLITAVTQIWTERKPENTGLSDERRHELELLVEQGDEAKRRTQESSSDNAPARPPLRAVIMVGVENGVPTLSYLGNKPELDLTKLLFASEQGLLASVSYALPPGEKSYLSVTVDPQGMWLMDNTSKMPCFRIDFTQELTESDRVLVNLDAALASLSGYGVVMNGESEMVEPHVASLTMGSSLLFGSRVILHELLDHDPTAHIINVATIFEKEGIIIPSSEG